MATLATLGRRAVAVHSGLSHFLSLCLFPVSLCLPPQLFPFFLQSVLCPKCRGVGFTLGFFYTSLLCGLVWPVLHPSLICLLYVSPCLPLSIRGQSFSRVVESWPPVVSCWVAKHIKAARRHIWQSEMMIRVPGLSKGTELSFVMQGIPPYLCLHLASNPSSDKGLTLWGFSIQRGLGQQC